MYLIHLAKVAECSEYAEYSFAASEAATPGLLRLTKSTGAIALITPIAGGRIGDPSMLGWRDPEHYFACASRKVTLAWREGKLPDSMVWAS